MEQEPAQADFLRFVSNSDRPLNGDPSMKDIRDKLKPLYPWIFDPELSSDNISEHFDFNGSVVLGQGNQAVVKTAINKSDGSKVACKCFKRQPPFQKSPFSEKIFLVPELSFLRELFFAIQLPQSPGFIKFYGAYLTDHEMIIVLSLHGPSLEERSLGRQYPLNELKKTAKEMLEIFQTLVNTGIWHCDPALRNFVVNLDDDHLTVVDFGFSFSSNRRIDYIIHPWTITLLPPETHISGSFEPEKSMVWTLGDNVYRMMTGTLPRITCSPVTITREEKIEIFEKEYQINPDWPEEVRIFLKAALVEEDKRIRLEQLSNLDLFK
jgi:serine/threonine protein kinase